MISCTNPHPFPLAFLAFVPPAVSHAHGPSLSLPGMPSSRNGPLLPRAAAAVAIKRQRQAADDGVPFSAALHNARVQLHRDEYAGQRIDGACDSWFIIFTRRRPGMELGERKRKISRISSELVQRSHEEISVRDEALVELTIAPTMAMMPFVMLRRSISPLRSSGDDSPIAYITDRSLDYVLL